MRLKAALPLLLLAVGCGSDPVHSIPFAAVVGSRPLDCAQSYDGIGTTRTTIKPIDLRLYAYDVTLVRASGDKVPLKLVPDGKWQSDRVAYLDFENGLGTCNTGSTELNQQIVGTAPASSDYVGLEFKIGVPMELNHLDAPTVEAPLNIPGMWWSWAGGYRFVKIDVQSKQNETWFFHLGATSCSGKVSTGFACKYENRPAVHLEGFELGKSTVVLDLEALYAGSDLDHQIDKVTDELPGCMADAGDPECSAIFASLGMGFESEKPNLTQRLFRVQK